MSARRGRPAMRPLADLMNLSGRVALVTGGAGRIGAAVVEVLAELRAVVVIVDTDRNRAQEVANGIAANHGTDVLVIPADLEDKEKIAPLARDVERAFGRLDI